MAYVHTRGVNPAIPAGTDVANVDDDMRDIKLAYNERFDDFFGVDWATDDPIEPTRIGSAVDIQGSQLGTAIYDAGNSGTSKTINWDNGDQQKVTLTGNVTFAFTNTVAGRAYVLYLVQDGTGGRTCTFPTSSPAVRVSNNTDFGTPSFTTTASRLTIVTLIAYTSNILVASTVATGVNAV
jgi:hypothetical protein